MIQNINVVAKSFIAKIETNTGSVPCSATDDSSDTKLKAFAALTDIGFSEDPQTDAKDKGYRMYSACTFTVTCEGGNLVSVVPSNLDTDSGTEVIILQAPPLTILEFTSGMTGPGPFSFSWRVKGRPHPDTDVAFNEVCPRNSVFIWHTVSGVITCNGDGVSVSVSITGSKFPSHRVFVNGAISSTVTQGPFSNLWVSDPSDPSDNTLVQ